MLRRTIIACGACLLFASVSVASERPTALEGVRMFGPPQSIIQYPGGWVRWNYRKLDIVIEFRGGHVRYIGRAERQTGVTEDLATFGGFGP